MPIYDGRLPATEIAARTEFVHRPYHEALARLLEAAACRHGRSLLVDMHSMPAFDRLNNKLPDIICGDGYGATLDRETATALTGFLQDCGLSVSWNHPYAGGFITRSNGDARGTRRSVQIEINRALYMDELRIEKNDGFGRVEAQMTDLIAALAQLTAQDLAAE